MRSQLRRSHTDATEGEEDSMGDDEIRYDLGVG